MLFALTLAVGLFIAISMIWTTLYFPVHLVARPPWLIQLGDLAGTIIALIMVVKTVLG